MQIHMQAFIHRHGQKQVGSKHQQTAMAQARQTENPQTGNNQGKVKTQSETARQRVNPRQAISIREGRDQTG